MPKNVAICVPGTWENGEGPRGMLTNVTDNLPGEDWEIVYLTDAEYPGSFGPVNPPGGDAGAPSYAHSVTKAAESVLNRYNATAPDQFVALLGYSQGEEGIARGFSKIVQQEHGRGRVRWYAGFGSPTRPQDHTYNRGWPLPFAGIAVYRMPLVPGVDYSWFGFPHDIFTCSNPQSFETLGYLVGTNFALSPQSFVEMLQALLSEGALQSLFIARHAQKNPSTPIGGMLGSVTGGNVGDLTSGLSGLAGVLGSSTTDPLGGLRQPGQNLFSSILGGLGTPPASIDNLTALGIDPVDLFFRAVNTATQLAESADGSHVWYADPAHPITGEAQTACAHSARFLTYVGKNGPIGG